MKSKYFIFTIAILLSMTSSSQQKIDEQIGNSIIQSISKKFPKFYNAFTKIKNDRYFKQYVFIRGNGTGSPASASENGIIRLDLEFIEKEIPNYDDNRLVVVIYHELGHLYYFKSHDRNSRNTQDNEKFAFEFSLKKTKEIAEQGDCQPLKTGIKFMALRSQSNNLSDEHVRALKIMVTEPLFESYKTFANSFTEKSNNKSFTNNSDSSLRIVSEKGLIKLYDINSPQTKEQKCIYLYIIKHNSENIELRMCIQYSESYRIDVTDYLINDIFKLHINKANLNKSKTSNYNSWYDVNVDTEILKIIKSIISSPTSILKYIGTTGTVEYAISQKDKNSLSNVFFKYIELTKR